jgi:hypothetical protein
VGWPAVAVITIVVAGGAWLARRLRARSPSAGGDARDRFGALLLALLVIAVVALLDNPFGAVTFLLAPVVCWVWATPSARRDRRALNGALIVLGFLPIVSLVAQYGQSLRIGPFIAWYLLMGIAYGQFTPLRVILTLAMIVVGVRLLAVSVADIARGAERPGAS